MNEEALQRAKDHFASLVPRDNSYSCDPYNRDERFRLKNINSLPILRMAMSGVPVGVDGYTADYCFPREVFVSWCHFEPQRRAYAVKLMTAKIKSLVKLGLLVATEVEDGIQYYTATDLTRETVKEVKPTERHAIVALAHYLSKDWTGDGMAWESAYSRVFHQLQKGDPDNDMLVVGYAVGTMLSRQPIDGLPHISDVQMDTILSCSEDPDLLLKSVLGWETRLISNEWYSHARAAGEAAEMQLVVKRAFGNG